MDRGMGTGIVVLMFEILSLGPGFHLLITLGAWRETAGVE